MGKLSGILFLFFAHFVSANVTISEDENFTVEETKAVSNQTENIYVTSGTTIIDLDNIIEGKIIIVKASVPNVDSTVKKEAPKKVVTKVDNEKYEKKTAVDNPSVYHSSDIIPFYSIGRSYTIAVVPSQVSHSKVFIELSTLIDNHVILGISQDKLDSFFTQFITSEFQNLFSGRAPPIFV